MGDNGIFQSTDNPLVEVLEFPQGFNMEKQHYHDLYEIYLLVKGERFVFLNNEAYCLNEGDMFIAEPFVLHSTRNLEPKYLKRYLINISQDALLSVLSKEEIKDLFKNFSTCILRLNKEQSSMMYDLFETVDMYSKRVDKRGVKLFHLSIFCLLDCLDSFLKMKKEEKVTLQGLRIQRNDILDVINYVNDNYDQVITLDFIAEFAHMSKSNFCHVFRQRTGETFLQYLNKFRLSKAHQMLVETDYSLSEIACKTGFTSTAHMTRIFRSVHGKSPSEFKKALKNI